jgi:hypothetical protein
MHLHRYIDIIVIIILIVYMMLYWILMLIIILVILINFHLVLLGFVSISVSLDFNAFDVLASFRERGSIVSYFKVHL